MWIASGNRIVILRSHKQKLTIDTGLLLCGPLTIEFTALGVNHEHQYEIFWTCELFGNFFCSSEK